MVDHMIFATTCPNDKDSLFAARVVGVTDAPNTPVEAALEPIVARGPRLHDDGEDGFR